MTNLLMQRSEAIWEVDDAQRRLEEQKYICDELKNGITCVKEYCADLVGHERILYELERHLECADEILHKCSAEVDAKFAELQRIERTMAAKSQKKFT